MQRKVELEARIEQQRIDMLLDASVWHDASHSVDNSWHHLQRFKAPLFGIGGFLMLRSARKPRSLLRVGKRILTGVLLFRRARRLLR
nr:YqjK-like family protein [Halomonas populi]